MRNLSMKYGPRFAVASGSLAGAASAFAQATDPATPAAALGQLTGSLSAFSPALYGLALASTIIVIGIAWIKKGRGAAK